MSKLALDEAITHAAADLAQLAPIARRLAGRVDSTLPGSGSSPSNAGGFNIDDPAYDHVTEVTHARPRTARPTAEEVLHRGRIAPTPTPTVDDDGPTPMTAAERRALLPPDVTQRDADAIIRHALDIRRATAKLTELFAPYLKSIAPDPNDVPDDWCPNHYRQLDRAHAGTFRFGSGKQKGQRKWAKGWCSYCGGFLAENGFLPTRKILDAKSRGSVTRSMIDTEKRRIASSTLRAAEHLLQSPTDLD